MTIQPTSLVTIKQAAAALGVDKQSIEERLESGQLQGKKERILSRDVWFIYKGELDSLLDKKEARLFGESSDGALNFSPQNDGMPDFAALAAALEQERSLPAQQDDHLSMTEQFQLSLKLMSEEFSRCMQSSLQHICELRAQLKESDSKLFLLTDMEKRASEDRQLLEHRADEDRQLIDDKDAALTKAHERIAKLQSEVERLSLPWWKRVFRA